MAKRDEEQRKLELLEQLTRQRGQISRQRSKLATQIDGKKEEIKEKINVPKRLKNNIRSSFSSSPTKWFLGSAVGGLVITKVLFGRRKSYRKASASEGSANVSRGLLTTALLYFGKPYIKSMLFRKGKSMLLRKFIPGQRQWQANEYEYEDTRPYH